MKKLLWLLLLIPLMGCMTANQMASEKNYYDMLGKIATSQQANPSRLLKSFHPLRHLATLRNSTLTGTSRLHGFRL
jgi:hypothetical protein